MVLIRILNIFHYQLDTYAILMIPSSKLAFQIVSAIISCIAVVTCGMTGYLLAFHIYLCKLIDDKIKSYCDAFGFSAFFKAIIIYPRMTLLLVVGMKMPLNKLYHNLISLVEII